MPPVPAAESGTHKTYAKAAGSEPLPGYKLISPLGRGGFGEVWKCVAPGGLHKAVKFVASESEDGRGRERFGQELAAFEQIKSIRHPFLLTLERVEQIDGELIMVMELADRQLQDRFEECRACGLPGIPRDELLGYFADAAEALDVIEAKFNLQHLDIKPANLFLVSGHVKVGDYGLVAQLEGSEAGNRGLTPRYVAPEVLHGGPSSRSDQYSLALVYQELLTGVFPYPGRTPQQLMLQHVAGTPNLVALPEPDQPVVARALAKAPGDRYGSCLEFVHALMESGADSALPASVISMRRSRAERSTQRKPGTDYPGAKPSVSARTAPTDPKPGDSRQEATRSSTLPGMPSSTKTGRSAASLPPLITGTQKPQAPGSRLSTGAINFPPPPATVSFDRPEEEAEAGMVVLDAIRSVMPVAMLLGRDADRSVLDPHAFAAAVVRAAARDGYAPQAPGEICRLAEGSWACQFPSSVPPTVVPLKLDVVRERHGVEVEIVDPARLILRRTAGGGGRFFGGKKYGFEVSVELPGGKPVGEVTLLTRLFGSPDSRFVQEAHEVLPQLLAEVRGQLNNVSDRRKHPRIACDLPLTLYPVHSDGSIDSAVAAQCRDVSLGGLSFVAPRSLQTKYVYAAFDGAPEVAGQAALIRLKRWQSAGTGRHYGAMYRTDL